MLLANAIWPWQWAQRYQLMSAAVLGYLILLLFARWYFVAVPARAHFRQKLDTMKVLTQGNRNAVALVDAAAGYLLSEGHLVGDVLALRRGEQLAGWRLLHAANRELEAARYDGPATLVRLKAEVGRLQDRKAIASTASGASEGDKALLKAASRDEHTSTTRAYLAIAMVRNDDLDDSAFEAASDLQRKAFWLCLVGLSAVLVLTHLVIAPIVIAAGALGGLLSRSIRPFDHPAKATDYGLGWSSLMLAPVNGALGGVAVIYVLSTGFFS